MKMRNRGFTLIELMIVVVIIAILAVIVYPTYERQIQKSRRGQAKADLAELAQGLEREFTANRSFTGYALPFATSPRSGGVVAYNVTGVIGANAYALKAAVTGPQASDVCGDLTLDEKGVRTHAIGEDTECNWGAVP